MANTEHQDFDVVVVGCGVAGLSAAVAAADAGARVAVVERSTYEERGGNTRYTAASMRMKSENEVSDDFESFLVRYSGYHIQPDFVAATALDYENWPSNVRTLPFTDPELISFFVDSVPPAVAWLKQHQATLEKNIKDQQMNRNRSVVLEILDTMQKFKTNIEKKFAKWREDDQYN